MPLALGIATTRPPLASGPAAGPAGKGRPARARDYKARGAPRRPEAAWPAGIAGRGNPRPPARFRVSGGEVRVAAMDPGRPPVIEGFEPSAAHHQERFSDKFKRKMRENPLVPIGEGGGHRGPGVGFKGRRADEARGGGQGSGTRLGSRRGRGSEQSPVGVKVRWRARVGEGGFEGSERTRGGVKGQREVQGGGGESRRGEGLKVQRGQRELPDP